MELVNNAISSYSSTLVKDLTISCNNLHDEGVVILVKSLMKKSCLQKIKLNCCGITERVADDLAVIVSRNPNLQVLDLAENNLQASGVIKIANALMHIMSLTKLYIGNNDVSGEAANGLGDVLSHNNNLQVLNLHENCLLTAGVIKIAKALCHISTLVELDIGNNGATEMAADYVAAAISHNTKLKVFDISGNYLQTVGIQKTSNSLQTISTLQRLFLRSNDANTYSASDIAAVLLHNTSLKVLDLGGSDLK